MTRCTQILAISVCWLSGVDSSHAGFLLSADTGTSNKLDAGAFAGGTVLSITVSGIVDLGGGALIYADGSLVSPYPVGSFYDYANPGATNYPTLFGGDGINHFPGGGGNIDLSLGAAGFGDAGKMTTDTTDPLAIRHGAVIGTFADSPLREDWFLIGFGTTIVVPGLSSHLYLAILDTNSVNNSGNYDVKIEAASPVPEPASLALLGLGTLGMGFMKRRRGNAVATVAQSRTRVPNSAGSRGRN